MIANNPEPVTVGGIPVDLLVGRFPTFCVPIPRDDDPTLAIGINFWAPSPIGDAEFDYTLGELHAQEALDFVRDHDEFEFFCAVFNWMGARLFHEERCVGPIERGFVDGIQTRDPGVVERFLMNWYQQHPERLN